MSRDLRQLGRFLALPTAALAVVVAFAPGRVEVAVRAYALVLATGLLALALVLLRRSYPRARPLRAAAPTDQPSRRPATLARIEQEIALGAAGSFDLHHRLRPRLRQIASELLVARRGVWLDREPERARAILGDATWEIVRPTRPVPEDRLARGIPIRDLDVVVESLERI